MSKLSVRPFQEDDQPAVVELWHRCGLVVPWNDPADDIACKLKIQRELFLVGTVGGKVVASVMAGYDGHRGGVNYLAVSPECQGQGFGRQLMEQVEQELRSWGCPKINLQVRTCNTGVIAFYQRLGYRLDDVVNLGKRLDGVEW